MCGVARIVGKQQCGCGELGTLGRVAVCGREAVMLCIWSDQDAGSDQCVCSEAWVLEQSECLYEEVVFWRVMCMDRTGCLTRC